MSSTLVDATDPVGPYDGPVPELPASVRVAVWASHAWARHADAETVVRAALPDADVVIGLVEGLRLWRDLGETAVYAALPRPGATGLLPGGDPVSTDAAVSAGECLFVAGIGGLLVPTQVGFGSTGAGLAVRWEPHDADPVPAHRLAGLDVAAADRRLRVTVHDAIDGLGDGGWTDAWQGRSAAPLEREWSLPGDLPERLRGLLARAGSVLEVADAGLEHADGSASAALSEQRRRVLLTVRSAASEALEVAACAAAGYLAVQSRRTTS